MLTAIKLEEYFNFLAEDDIRLKRHRIGIEGSRSNMSIQMN